MGNTPPNLPGLALHLVTARPALPNQISERNIFLTGRIDRRRHRFQSGHFMRQTSAGSFRTDRSRQLAVAVYVRKRGVSRSALGHARQLSPQFIVFVKSFLEFDFEQLDKLSVSHGNRSKSSRALTN